MEGLTALIGHYGLVAVFLGCLAEGESIAIIGGFFAHQGVLALWPTFATAALGAFLGDTLLFALGRYAAGWRWVAALREKPGFGHALALASRRPQAFVFFNRYVYGMRLIGGVAAGLAGIPWRVLILWNALSSLVWAALFIAIGWFFGLSAEALLGEALRTHERLIVGLLILAAVIAFGIVVARRVRRREVELTKSGRDGDAEG